MRNVFITEAHGENVNIDQDADNETVVAQAGGIAINGDVDDSALNTGRNDGILAGKDVTIDDSILGDGNLQLNDSEVGAFSAGSGNATNAVAGPDGNVNLGGQLIDTDTGGGDAQVVTGDGNDVRGDVDFDLKNVDGPINLTAGDGNSQTALEDNSTNVIDSFKADFSQEDSGNTLIEKTKTITNEDNDTHETKILGSGNTEVDIDAAASYETSWEERSSDWDEAFEQRMGAFEHGGEGDFDLD